MSGKIVLIGLDGATFTVLDPLMAQGVMPHLKRIVEAGVRAELRTIVPALTPPAWTSLMTGRRPGHHGVFDFFQKSSVASEKVEFTTSKDVRVPTVWKMVSDAGKKVTVLNFPLMFPAPEINGHIVAGWLPWRQLRLGCHPRDLYDRLKALPGFNVRELAMDMELEAKATEGAAEDEHQAWVELHTRREEQWLKVAAYLMQQEPADLMAVLFDGPDKTGHLLWRYIDPAWYPANPTSEEARIHELCLNYYRKLDDAIGQIAELAGDETTIVLASDHGFGATVEVVNLNVWLAEKGYLKWMEQINLGDKGGTLGMSHLSRHVNWFDWSQTKAYASTPTGNGIHIVNVPAQEYEAFRNQLIADLRGFVDGQTGEPIIKEIYTREEAFDGSAMDLAPDLTLVLRDGGLISILPASQPLNPRSKPEGTHRPNGIFIAKGNGILANKTIPELSILDITPLLLYNSGLSIPSQLEGRVPEEIFETNYLKQNPVKRSAAETSDLGNAQPNVQEELFDEDAEAAILARLMELGYVD